MPYVSTTGTPGVGTWLPNPWVFLPGNSAYQFNTDNISANTEKLAFIGNVVTPNRGTKNLVSVGVRLGAITLNSASVLSGSLQGVSTTATNPFRPNGTPDQFFTIASSSLLASQFQTLPSFNITRSVNHGDLLAFVLEFSTFVAADSVVLSSVQSGMFANNAGVVKFTSSSQAWSLRSNLPNIVFNYDDGTVGGFVLSTPIKSFTSTTYNNASSNNEIAAQITLEQPMIIDGAWASVNLNGVAFCHFDIAMYNASGTLLASGSVNGEAVASNNVGGMITPVVFSSPVSASIGTYYAAVRPTTTGSLRFDQITVSASACMAMLPMGAKCSFAQRNHSSSFSETTASRGMAGFIVGGYDDGSSATTIIGAPLRVIGNVH